MVVESLRFQEEKRWVFRCPALAVQAAMLLPAAVPQVWLNIESDQESLQSDVSTFSEILTANDYVLMDSVFALTHYRGVCVFNRKR